MYCRVQDIYIYIQYISYTVTVFDLCSQSAPGSLDWFRTWPNSEPWIQKQLRIRKLMHRFKRLLWAKSLKRLNGFSTLSCVRYGKWIETQTAPSSNRKILFALLSEFSFANRGSRPWWCPTRKNEPWGPADFAGHHDTLRCKSIPVIFVHEYCSSFCTPTSGSEGSWANATCLLFTSWCGLQTYICTGGFGN